MIVSYNSMLILVKFCRIKEVTGIANLQRGLYVLDSACHTSTCNFVANNSCDLWHISDIGHISNIGLQTVSKLFSFIHCKNNVAPCDAYYFSKQRRLPFSNSITHSCDPFDILHADFGGISPLLPC